MATSRRSYDPVENKEPNKALQDLICMILMGIGVGMGSHSLWFGIATFSLSVFLSNIRYDIENNNKNLWKDMLQQVWKK